jgi:hypothetical protein
MREAFAEYEGILAVPSSAHGESVDDVRSAMQRAARCSPFGRAM